MNIAPEQIRSIFARWQNLEAEKAATGEDLKDLFAEAKSNGFDPKILRAAFRQIQKEQDNPDAAQEFEAIADLYLDALRGTNDAIARVREVAE